MNYQLNKQNVNKKPNDDYNLLSYTFNVQDEFEVIIHKLHNNLNRTLTNKDKEYAPSFQSTKAYDTICTSNEKCVYINNGSLNENDSYIKEPNNKYFMLINVDGYQCSRKQKIIFDINKNNINHNDISVQTFGGMMIPSTFYIINTWFGDIENNIKNIITDIISNNLILDVINENIKINNIINQVKSPLNIEKYGVIQQIVFIIAEKMVGDNPEFKKFDDNVNDLIKQIIQNIKENINYQIDYDEVHNRQIISYKFMYTTIINPRSPLIKFPRIDETKQSLIIFFKDMIGELLQNLAIKSKILFYDSIYNNQIGRSRNNGLLITWELLSNHMIDERYIKVLDSSGYLSYYGNVINKLFENETKMNVDDQKIYDIIKNERDMKINIKEIQEPQLITNPETKFDKVMTFDYIKLDDSTGEINIEKKKIDSSRFALYNSYNLHLYGVGFFYNNIDKFLCFDCDVAEDSGNGRVVNKKTCDHSNDNYLTIYGKMNTHYIAPIIQIFNISSNGDKYIIAALEDEMTQKWVDISNYKNIISEITCKSYIILEIEYENSMLYIYINNVNSSQSSQVLYKLFNNQKGKKDFTEIFEKNEGILQIHNNKIYYSYNNNLYNTNVYLGRCTLTNFFGYYNYLYNLLNYQQNSSYTLKSLTETKNNLDVNTFSKIINDIELSTKSDIKLENYIDIHQNEKYYLEARGYGKSRGFIYLIKYNDNNIKNQIIKMCDEIYNKLKSPTINQNYRQLYPSIHIIK